MYRLSYVGAANPAGAVDFMLKRLGLSGLKATDTGHIDVSGLKEPAVHIAVDGFLTRSEERRVG